MNRTGEQGKRALLDVMPGRLQEIEMNQEYFGNWKAFREKVKRRWGNLILCSRVRPIWKTKVPVNHRSNAR